jgi:hypothetical protein
MVYGMVQRHKGAIHVDSEPGKGATFTVYLPSGGKNREGDDTEELEPPPRGWDTILVAEDEPMVRKLAVRESLVMSVALLSRAWVAGPALHPTTPERNSAPPVRSPSLRPGFPGQWG